MLEEETASQRHMLQDPGRGTQCRQRQQQQEQQQQGQQQQFGGLHSEVLTGSIFPWCICTLSVSQDDTPLKHFGACSSLPWG